MKVVDISHYHVTEHAIDRFCERVLKLKRTPRAAQWSLKRIKTWMAHAVVLEPGTDRRDDRKKHEGQEAYLLGGSTIAYVKDSTITTVVSKRRT